MDPERLAYIVLFYTIIMATGAGAVGVLMATMFRHNIKRWWAYALAKLGLVGTNLILIARLAPQSTLDLEGPLLSYVVGYTFFMAVTALGVFFVSGDLARRGGKVAAQQAVQTLTDNTAHERVTALEDRVTAEEARNTDIEDLARAHKAGTEDQPSKEHVEEEKRRE